MTAEQLIAKLRRMVDEYGDLDIRIDANLIRSLGCSDEIEDVYYLANEEEPYGQWFQLHPKGLP